MNVEESEPIRLATVDDLPPHKVNFLILTCELSINAGKRLSLQVLPRVDHTVRGVLRCEVGGSVCHYDSNSSDLLNSKRDGLPDLNPELPESLAVSITPPSPIPNLDGDSTVSIAPPSPISSVGGGSDESIPASDCPIYLFQYEDEEFNLPIPTAWTVFETKGKVAVRYHTIADYVSLFFFARNLKDEALLIHQRIGNKKIDVYVHCFDPTLLESIGYGSRRGVEKPSDFVERVNQLERDTGQDRRTCSRCLIFYDYDVDRARSALEMIESA
jgi:hypothetical protein